MTTLKQLLHDNDPSHDISLTVDEVRRLRQTIVAPPDSRTSRMQPMLAFASLILVVLFLATLVTDIRRNTAPSKPAQLPSRTHQVQLTTPGGTRVIWLFNDRFSM